MTTEISADPIGPEDYPAIEHVLASIRPAIEADGGIVQLAGTRGDTVILRLGGKCMGCIQSGETLGAIRRALMHTLGKAVRVIPARDD
jgi:NifU-like protein